MVRWLEMSTTEPSKPGKSFALTLAVPGAIAVVVVVFLVLRGSESPKSIVSTSPPPVPVTAPEAASAPGPAGSGPTTGSAVRRERQVNSQALDERARARLKKDVTKALEEGGPRAAFLKILENRRLVPQGLEERVQRALACSYLPALCARDPSLLPEAKGLLSSWAKDDPDAFSRYAALTTLLGYPTHFTQVAQSGLFETDPSERLPKQSQDLDGGALPTSPEEAAGIRRLMVDIFARETEWSNRVMIIRALRVAPKPEEVTFLRTAAVTDPNKVVRYWSIETLAQYPPTAETRATLFQAMETDPNEDNRNAALLNLAGLGSCDEVIASRLLQMREKDLATFETIGKAYAQSQLPSLAGFVRDRLMSSSPQERAWAAAAALASGDAGFAPALQEAAGKETDPGVRRAFARALEKLSPSKDR